MRDRPLIRPSVRTGAPSPKGEGVFCLLFPVPGSLLPIVCVVPGQLHGAVQRRGEEGRLKGGAGLGLGALFQGLCHLLVFPAGHGVDLGPGRGGGSAALVGRPVFLRAHAAVEAGVGLHGHALGRGGGPGSVDSQPAIGTPLIRHGSAVPPSPEGEGIVFCLRNRAGRSVPRAALVPCSLFPVPCSLEPELHLTRRPAQGALDAVVDAVEDLPLVEELDLGLGGMDVHIHSRQRHGDVEHAAGEAAGHDLVAVGLLQGGGEGLGADVAVVDEEMLVGPGAPGGGGL